MTPQLLVKLTALIYAIITQSRAPQLTLADNMLTAAAATQGIKDLQLPDQAPHYELAAVTSLLKRTIVTPSRKDVKNLLTPVMANDTVAAADRHIRQASRDRVLQSVYADDRIQGWARMATGAETCPFCDLLVSRGPVYRSQGTASFTSHDRCDCIAVPVFKGKKWAGEAQANHLYSEYLKATKGYSGQDAINAWRRYRTTGTPATSVAA